MAEKEITIKDGENQSSERLESAQAAEIIPNEPITNSRRSPRLPFAAFQQRFDSIVPPHRTYYGLRRRSFLLIVGGVSLALLILILGLSIGLAGKSKTRNLPLPNDKDHYSGDLTYYGPGLGACGITSSDGDSIVAVSHYLFDAMQRGSNPNANPICGKKIRASRFNEQAGAQRSVDLTVVDRCVGCQPTDLDVTTSVFKQLANPDLGRVGVTWAWLD